MSTTVNENDSTFRAAYLSAILTRLCPDARPYHVAKVVTQMQKATRMALAWETRRCNDPMGEKQNEQGYARISKAEEQINLALQELGNGAERATVELGGDPRGACGSLIVAYNSDDNLGVVVAIA